VSLKSQAYFVCSFVMSHLHVRFPQETQSGLAPWRAQKEKGLTLFFTLGAKARA
jgi:hypothetical protein